MPSLLKRVTGCLGYWRCSVEKRLSKVDIGQKNFSDVFMNFLFKNCF